jgi:peptidoglycan/LPS O-acetylase OafA/YrhL
MSGSSSPSCIGLAIALIVGFLTYTFIEKPMIRWGRSLRKSSSAPTAAAAAATVETTSPPEQGILHLQKAL